MFYAFSATTKKTKTIIKVSIYYINFDCDCMRYIKTDYILSITLHDTKKIFFKKNLFLYALNIIIIMKKINIL